MKVAYIKNKGEQLTKKKWQIFKNDFAKTVAIFLIALAFVGGFWLTLRAVLKTDYPLQAVVSESMVPTLNVGDLVLVQYVNPMDVKVSPVSGDIIVFRKPYNPDEFIVHRAIDSYFASNGNISFITKGDFNPTRDYWSGSSQGGVPAENLIGKVVFRIPLIGYLKIYVGTPLGMSVIVVLIVILLFIDYIPLNQKKTES